MLKKIFIILLVIKTFISAEEQECKIEDNIILSILENEKHPKKGIGYNYLISLNNKKDVKKLQKTSLSNFFIDNRTIDCKNKELCTFLSKTLYKTGIKNMDLGAFQINPKFHKREFYKYFDLRESYKIACSFISKNIKKYGYTWRSIARYHSSNSIRNSLYANNLIRNYRFITEWKRKYEDGAIGR